MRERPPCVHLTLSINIRIPRRVQAVRCDLDEWRARERLPPAQTAALDADSGAGWDIARALLRPRKLQAGAEAMPWRAACLPAWLGIRPACVCNVCDFARSSMSYEF